MRDDPDGWPYPDPPRHPDYALHARDLYSKEEREAFKEDRGTQILATAGRGTTRRPCKCKVPTTTKRRPWACTKCGGAVKQEVNR